VVGEYKYVDLGSTTVNFNGLPAVVAAAQTEAITQRHHVMTPGVNYKLDGSLFAVR
jgi:hypothetical protein